MALLKVRDRSGVEHELQADNGIVLMEALRDGDFGVEGTCGGACSCGTCHVYIDAAWATKLAPAGEDEKAMIEAIGEVAEVRPGSRLSCQILVKEELAGMTLQVGPLV